jgi:hypothetical protein
MRPPGITDWLKDVRGEQCRRWDTGTERRGRDSGEREIPVGTHGEMR